MTMRGVVALPPTTDFRPGMIVHWHAVVSNYGHIQAVRAVVLSVSAKRVRIETRYDDGKPERRVNVKAENLQVACE